ncbi:YppG family protein [Fredinandcohnia quinoae]|uniref:YppG family protein n=1 Tax=Fredinandcohnia quinoae TaxID=2918902 RepID=A0AAW5E3N7_9BACI|nr:YppG family protein [Fredinandcohnia sp. SECRCQ15]MCH1624702.1 YppG family protein [Fredinandcohnia sp. SECRCQ15]
MYQNYGRSKYITKPYGHSWPYYSQPNYQSYLYPYSMFSNQSFSNNFPPQTSKQQQQPYFSNSSSMYTPYPTPYPIGNMNQQQTAGVQSFLSQFKKKDGTYDVNKLMDTAGQMMGAVNQVSSIVKGLSQTFKS